MPALPVPGTRYVRERVLRQADFDLFAKLSGDDNPIHVDPQFAARTRFGATVSHGMLLYAALRGLIAEHLPGARQRAQELMFPAPTYADVPVRFEVEILEVGDDGTCTAAMRAVQDGTVTLDGTTLLVLEAEGGS